MRYYRIRDEVGNTHLTVENDPGILVSLTDLNEEVKGFEDLLKVHYIGGQPIDDVTRNILSQGNPRSFSLLDLENWSKDDSNKGRIIRPIDPDEVWAGGIGNYSVPDELVEKMPDFTKKAYENERPPILYNGGSTRLVGPFDNIGIRSDTSTVAEGELVLVIYKGELVAYSTGNEVAGGLMGETIWWMVPSKVFKGCASLGPCIVTPESLTSPTDRSMELTINRKGQIVGKSSNTTAHRRAPEDIIRWVTDHDSPPDLMVIYTGGCVADGPLEAGDLVKISLEGIGSVENTVEIV